MLGKVKNLFGNMLVFAAFSLLLGFALLCYPTLSEKIICYSVAVLCVVYGLVHVTLHFMSREAFTFPLDLILGIVGIVAGVILVLFPIVIIRILPIILGIICAIDGLMKIINAFDLTKFNYSYWWLILLMGIASIALGVLMIVYPFEWPILVFVGYSFIANGLFDVFNMFVIAKYKN